MKLNLFGKSKSKPTPPRSSDIQKVMERYQKEDKRIRVILDKHFGYQQEIQHWYPLRNSQKGAKENAIRACQAQVAMSKQAMQAFHDSDRLHLWYLHEIGDPPDETREMKIPRHIGFEQLAIIREKDGDVAESIRLCQQAKNDGWNGDWDKRIARLERKRG